MSLTFYEPREVAELLRVSETTIRRMIRSGTLLAITVGRQHRIPRYELARFVVEGGLSLQALPPSLDDLMAVFRSGRSPAASLTSADDISI